jgi:hypothetical protein
MLRRRATKRQKAIQTNQKEMNINTIFVNTIRNYTRENKSIRTCP